MSKPASRIDQQLQRDLKKAKSGPVDAVVALRIPSGEFPEAGSSQKTIEEVLDRVERRCGKAPARVKVFPDLGRFAISAPPGFIKELVAQPEIDSAKSNKLPDIAFHPKKRPA